VFSLPRSMPAQGRLNSKAVQWVPTYTTTHRNKTVNVYKIKHIFIVLVLPTKSVFKYLKTCRTQHT